jgi:hypothetical protein
MAKTKPYRKDPSPAHTGLKKYERTFMNRKQRRSAKQHPICVNCDKPADYSLHGSWVCKVCYPHGDWNNSEGQETRKVRREKSLQPKKVTVWPDWALRP